MLRRPPLYFFMGAISAPKTKEQTLASPIPGAERLRRTHGEVRRHASDPWRMLPWRARAKPLGVGRRRASAHLGVVCEGVSEEKSPSRPEMLLSHVDLY